MGQDHADANSTGNWGVNYIDIMLDEGDYPPWSIRRGRLRHLLHVQHAWGLGTNLGRWRFHQQDPIGHHGSERHPRAYYIDGSLDDAMRRFAASPTYQPLRLNLTPNGLT